MEAVQESKAVVGSASKHANVLVPRTANFPKVRDAPIQRFSGPFSDFTDGHTHALWCVSEPSGTHAKAAAHRSSFPAADKIVLRKPNFQAS
jgi:hypothetical protein